MTYSLKLQHTYTGYILHVNDEEKNQCVKVPIPASPSLTNTFNLTYDVHDLVHHITRAVRRLERGYE